MGSATKTQWTDGDEGWEVEWCKELPVDENGDNDLDNAKQVCRNFRTLEEANTYASSVLPRAVFGEVFITPFVLERLDDSMRFHLTYNCTKEYTGEPEVIGRD